MIPLWLALIVVLGAIAGILVIIALICYAFVGVLKIKERKK